LELCFRPSNLLLEGELDGHEPASEDTDESYQDGEDVVLGRREGGGNKGTDYELRWFLPQGNYAYHRRMSQVARIIVSGLPHHVTQRGNNRQDVFFAPKNVVCP
jgi:hypothetical protein